MPCVLLWPFYCWQRAPWLDPRPQVRSTVLARKHADQTFEHIACGYAHPVRVGTIAFVHARLFYAQCIVCNSTVCQLLCVLSQDETLLSDAQLRTTIYIIEIAYCRLRHIHRGDIHRESNIFDHRFSLHAYTVPMHHAVAVATYAVACSPEHLLPIAKVPQSTSCCSLRPKSCCNPWAW